MEINSYICGIWLGSLFLYSGLLKLAHYHKARAALVPYDILPARVASGVGAALPWVEVATGITVLTGVGHPLGAGVGALLGVAFAYAAARVLLRAADVPCGCTASSSDRVDALTLWRGLMIVAASLLLIAIPSVTPTPTTVLAVTSIVVLPAALVFKQTHRMHRTGSRRDRKTEPVPASEIARLRSLLTTTSTS